LIEPAFGPIPEFESVCLERNMPAYYPLEQYRDLARAVAASVLDRPIAEITDDTPLDSDDLDLVVVELSLAGIEVGRGDLASLHPEPGLPDAESELSV
jgi:hypothetical protein